MSLSIIIITNILIIITINILITTDALMTIIIITIITITIITNEREILYPESPQNCGDNASGAGQHCFLYVLMHQINTSITLAAKKPESMKTETSLVLSHFI